MSSFSLIVPAAGLGERMGTKTPKPYLQLAGKTVLERTLTCFVDLPGLTEVIISTSDTYRRQSTEILESVFPVHKTVVVPGGKRRQDSIYNALQVVSKESTLVVVHDAVRPFTGKTSIENCLKQAELFDGAIVAVPVKDTIKEVSANGVISGTPDRSKLWQAQTPQIFKREVLIKANSQAIEKGYPVTDDASLVEAIGGKVKIVEGERDNFKLTYPIDFRIAELLIDKIAP